jgi:nucleoside-diphosphate-sugar epimerase
MTADERTGERRFGRVLVTGASGFVGGAVVRRLRESGHEVVGLVRSRDSGRSLEASGVRVALGDMRTPESFVPLVAEVDAVVHAAQLATAGRFGKAKLDAVRAADHAMTAALAAECIARKRRLVYTSGVFSYGDCGDTWVTEDTPFNPSPLGVGHANEIAALRELAARQGLDYVVVSAGFVVGPGGLFKTSFYDQAKERRLRVIGAGSNYWSCVQVDDLGAAFAAALERAPSGAEYNVVDDHPLTLRELVDEVTKAMKMDRVGRVPAWLIGLIIGGPLVQSLVTSFRVRNAKARAELGWAPRFSHVREALPSAIDGLAARAR